MTQQTHDHALAAFEHAAEEIRFFKAQQWRVANYTLLAEAAAVTVPALLDGAPQFWARIAAALMALLAAATGSALLASLDRAIDKERARLGDARDMLPTLHEIHSKRPAAARGVVAGVLHVVMVLGAVVAATVNVLLMDADVAERPFDRYLLHGVAPWCSVNSLTVPRDNDAYCRFLSERHCAESIEAATMICVPNPLP